MRTPFLTKELLDACVMIASKESKAAANSVVRAGSSGAALVQDNLMSAIDRAAVLGSLQKLSADNQKSCQVITVIVDKIVGVTSSEDSKWTLLGLLLDLVVETDDLSTKGSCLPI